MEVFGYLASILIGISLGLIGGGGSILTVPVLVYLFGIDSIIATSYSLFIVGITATIGFYNYLKDGFVNIKTAIVFAIPSVISVFITRTLIVKAIPSVIIQTESFVLTKSALLLLIFALLMLAASYNMIKKEVKVADATHENKLLVFILGVFVGFLTGLVGAGGGFLIIPALVSFLKTPMKTAVGTSLLIISINSLFGFFSTTNIYSVDWFFILSITGTAIIGIFIGFALSRKTDGKKLKPGFGWFILLMGTYIILKELFLRS
jgi:uncharacterized membrane protein YfcA